MGPQVSQETRNPNSAFLQKFAENTPADEKQDWTFHSVSDNYVS